MRRACLRSLRLWRQARRGSRSAGSVSQPWQGQGSRCACQDGMSSAVQHLGLGEPGQLLDALWQLFTVTLHIVSQV